MSNNLGILLSDLFTVYVKTLNYHWHVVGPNFKVLHEHFEEMYGQLQGFIDEIAERIRALDEMAPATLESFLDMRQLADGDATNTDGEMVDDLIEDLQHLSKEMASIIREAEDGQDHATADLITGQLREIEKQAWMLKSLNA